MTRNLQNKMVLIRTISSVITAVFTIGIYDRIGPRKDGADFIDKPTVTENTVYNSLQAHEQDQTKDKKV
jgi:hypothetical protein